MPMFDFRCEDCGHEFEELESRDETIHPHCPKCEGQTKRLLSPGEFKIAGTPPRDWKPLKKSNPKSHIVNMREQIEKRNKERAQ